MRNTQWLLVFCAIFLIIGETYGGLHLRSRLSLVKGDKSRFKFKNRGSLQSNLDQSIIHKISNKTFKWNQSTKQLQILVNEKIVYESQAGKPFLMAAEKAPSMRESQYGSLFINNSLKSNQCNHQVLDQILLNQENMVVIEGSLSGSGCEKLFRTIINFEDHSESKSNFTISSSLAPLSQNTWLALTGKTKNKEKYFGGGEQFTQMILNGHQVPFLTQEQGHGRGRWITTFFTDLTTGLSGGDQFTTYASVPVISSSDWKSFRYLGKSFSLADFRNSNRYYFWTLDGEAEFQFIGANDSESLMKNLTEQLGRPEPLPEWFYRSAILGGFVGGEEELQLLLDTVDNYQIPTEAIWIEDWTGSEKTLFGKRLYWNWEVSKDLYPNWDSITADIKSRGMKIGGYLNPLTRPLPEQHVFDFNMYEEAKENGYLLKNNDGTLHNSDLGAIPAYYVDLFNPEAYQWLLEKAGNNMAKKGISFWNADFGESIGTSITSTIKESVEKKHEYIELWAKLNREIVDKYLDKDGVAFLRSGYTETMKYASAFWKGDQFTTWDRFDGFHSTIIAGITSGMSGMLINHADIGGWIDLPLIIARKRELMLRWTEQAAFSPIFRNKEGVGKHKLSTLKDHILVGEFARFAKIYRSLYPYRKIVLQEAYEKGLPAMRPLFFYHSDLENSFDIDDQYYFGSEMIIAPVVKKRRNFRYVQLPPGKWTHLWSGRKIDIQTQTIERFRVRAQVGCPPVFYKTNSTIMNELAPEITEFAKAECKEDSIRHSPLD